MSKATKIITTTVTFSALLVVLSAGAFLATYNTDQPNTADKQTVAAISTSPTGLLGATDAKDALTILASLAIDPANTDTQTIDLSITNSTDSTVQFSPSIDLFVRDKNNKTYQVYVDNGDPLANGPFKNSEVRTGKLHVNAPSDVVLSDLYYQPNNSAKSYRIAL